MIVEAISIAYFTHCAWIYALEPTLRLSKEKADFDLLIEETSQENVLLALEMMTEAFEEIYSVTSGHGVQFTNSYRAVAAEKMSIARQVIGHRQGAPRVRVVELAAGPYRTWPFNAKGEVKL